jgi:hypothetical protein
MVAAPTYGKWRDRKLWTVHESICLMLSLEPETPWLKGPGPHDVGGMDPLIQAFEQYSELATEAMKDKLLVPFSPWDFTRPPLERRVIPRAFLAWAKSCNIAIPEELAPVLAQEPFETGATEPSVLEHLGRGYTLRGTERVPGAYEQVLGAALAALRSFPERCRDAAGIRRIIEENAPLIWTDTRKAPLPAEEIERVVGQWLGRLG